MSQNILFKPTLQGKRKILASDQRNEYRATVTFHATLLQNGQDASFTEQSLFKQHQGRWFYVRALAQN